MSNFNNSKSNITKFANNLIHYYTIQSGDNFKNKSFSACSNSEIDKSTINQIPAGINSILMLYNQCKLLTA